MTERFDGVRAVVVGAGVAGTSAARVLLRLGADVLVSDERDPEGLGSLTDLREAGAQVRAGGHDPWDIDGADLLLLSPGVRPDSILPTLAHERGVRVWGEMELGARIATAPYVAVTGTNGKTTTTGMIRSCLEAAGSDAVACGNIGRPFPEAALEEHDVLVVEVSSFQLATQTSFHPVVSVLLNVAEDHVDWHGSAEAYRRSKARIFAAQIPADTHVGNRDDAVGAAISASAPCPTVWIRRDAPNSGEVGFVDGVLHARLAGAAVSLGPVEDERAGFREDAAAAAAASLAFGASADAVAEGLARYRPAPHRGEVVAELGGVRFLDNSKATNVHAALAAIAAVHGPLVLIAGGRAKGQDLAPLAGAAARCAAVVAIGEAAGDIISLIRDVTPVVGADSMADAVRVAFALCPRPGTVLLAPACASWDMYADYAERGRNFAEAAAGLGAPDA